MDDNQCPICFVLFNNTTTIAQELPCKHIFCKKCLSGWKKAPMYMSYSGCCPICRAPIAVAERSCCICICMWWKTHKLQVFISKKTPIFSKSTDVAHGSTQIKTMLHVHLPFYVHDQILNSWNCIRPIVLRRQVNGIVGSDVMIQAFSNFIVIQQFGVIVACFAFFASSPT